VVAGSAVGKNLGICGIFRVLHGNTTYGVSRGREVYLLAQSGDPRYKILFFSHPWRKICRHSPKISIASHEFPWHP
jgi:hypothetical protein